MKQAPCISTPIALISDHSVSNRAVLDDVYVRRRWAASLEATRAAALAIHSAAGFMIDVDRPAARLLRAAEGLCRSAVALVKEPPVPAPPSQSPSPNLQAALPARRRRRGKRGKTAQNGNNDDDNHADVDRDAMSDVLAAGLAPLTVCKLEGATEKQLEISDIVMSPVVTGKSSRHIESKSKPAIDDADDGSEEQAIITNKLIVQLQARISEMGLDEQGLETLLRKDLQLSQRNCDKVLRQFKGKFHHKHNG